ncbi:hypothetical protein AYI70_g5024 [Smittium culicis]|uniref:Uncharacterized protein n=1 Tax=Smittium culicis TaxID=133412 RepID=A0A1R1XWB8_9FUNG|nr:hypothetical protein AYI70_g5024 [Smittium culicis]
MNNYLSKKTNPTVDVKDFLKKTKNIQKYRNIRTQYLAIEIALFIGQENINIYIYLYIYTILLDMFADNQPID